LAQAAYDGYLSAYETASANVGVGKAAIQQAQAGVSQASAALRKAQRNLSLCTIKSPVKGVIIDRRVNIGQTVVASLNAPSLFLIAKDLKQMQVWVAVNEADISKIHRGQPVTFTVDAFPGETFKGQVGKVRLNASMTQNVVIYTVEILTDNSSGKLLPYLTANVRFELSRRDKVLLAPNAALRWKPSSEQIAPRWREKIAERSEENGSEGRRPEGAEKRPPAESGRGRLWVAEGKFVRPFVVRSGDGDGTLTEVAGEGVIEGLEVVIGLHQQNKAGGDTSNPFAPSFPRGGGRPR
jgi:HlyD family secretion protein